MKWVEKFSKMGRRSSDSASSFSPRQFGDEIAERTSWEPLAPGGASFRTHQLVKSGAHRLEFKPALGAIVFCWLFIVVGVGMLIGFAIDSINNGSEFETPILVVPCVGVLFTVVGTILLRSFMRPAVFDKRSGYFRKGVPKSGRRALAESNGDATRLNRVHAIQILSEYCRGNDSSYTSYEINLVLDDAERVNVVDHGSLRVIRTDAEAISDFLGRPIWSAVEE